MSTPLVRVRRRRTGTAAAAYSHALAILRSPGEAEKVASIALRRGAQSRSAVLAHARYITTERAGTQPNADLDKPVSGDLRTLAEQLAQTRPITERSIVDLELRYGLDHGSFSRVLGVSASRARQLSEAVASTWKDSLDPAMMASLGPGACDQLRQILPEMAMKDSDTEPGSTSTSSAGTFTSPGTSISGSVATPLQSQIQPTIRTFTEIAPTVLQHTRACDVCAQRLKMMTPVRSLVGHIAAEDVPTPVLDAARAAKRRLPTALPPSIEASRVDLRRLRTPVFAVLVTLVLLIAIYGLVKVAIDASGSETQNERVARLIESAPSASLIATPTIVSDGSRTASLANNSDRPILWNATTSAPWLTVEPSSGRLNAHQNVALTLHAAETGAAVVTITSSDGSTQNIRFSN